MVVLQTIFIYRSILKDIIKGSCFLRDFFPTCKPNHHARWRYDEGRARDFSLLPLAT